MYLQLQAVTKLAWVCFKAMIPCLWAQDHELNFILLLDYEFALPRYGINDTRLVGI